MNLNGIKDAMKQQGISVDRLAEISGLDRAKLYRRFNTNGEKMTVSELKTITAALGLSKDTVVGIFFSE